MNAIRFAAIRPQTLRRCVRALQAAIVLLTVALLAVLLRPPPAWQPPALEIAASQPAQLAKPERPLDLAIIWKRDLRQPPVDPPPPAAATPTPEAPLSIRLVGTVVEAERRFAVFATADNSVSVREVGATIAGHEVIAVERGSATVRRGSRDYQLRVPWFDRIAAETASAARGTP